MPVDRSLCSGSDGMLNARLAPSPLLYLLLDKEIDWHEHLQPATPDRDMTIEQCVLPLCARLHGDTAALAIGLIDVMLANTNVHSKYMNVLALTCVFIAAKVCEEEVDVSVDTLLEMAGVTYGRADVLRMEKCVLNKCGWDVSLPTAHRFAQLMISLCPCSARERLALEPKIRPVMLAAVSNHEIVYGYRPSCIALACLTFTQLAHRCAHLHNTILWLASLTKTSMGDIREVCALLGSSRGRKRRRRLNTCKGNNAYTKCYNKKQRDVDWLECDWTPALHLLMGQ